MTDQQNMDYARYSKRAWIIYALMAVVFAAILVLFVATDNEERFFYGLMPLAAAYVLRPGEKRMAKYVLKYTGVSKPAD